MQPSDENLVVSRTSLGEQMETDGLRVFVSYSRADESFVQELVSGLELVGIIVTIDTRDIAEGEDWRARLGAMIESADSVVFVLSTNSVSSEMCNWEVETAVSKGKRLVPVLKENLGGLSPHSKLSEIHYVRFDAEDNGAPRSFIGALRALSDTLKLDVNWLREHTRLQIRAREWDESARSEHRLMRAQDIAHAKAWMEQRPAGAPPLTEIQIAFIHESEDAEEKRSSAERERLAAMQQAQADREIALKDKEETVRKLSRRTTIGLGATGGLAVASAGLAYWGTSAERRFNQARKDAQTAESRTREQIINRDALRKDLSGVMRVSAAAPGEVAYDTYDGSAFSRILAQHSTQDKIAFEEAVQLTRDEIYEQTGGQQTVYVETYLNSRVYLARRPENQIRKALIWVGSDYQSDWLSPLQGTRRDGEHWQAALEAAGFETSNIVDPTYADMMDSMTALSRQMDAADLHQAPDNEGAFEPETTVSTKGLVPIIQRGSRHNGLSVLVFSGHAFQLDNQQYLAARDSVPDDEQRLKRTSVPLAVVLDILDDTNGASILALDACRNNLEFRADAR